LGGFLLLRDLLLIGVDRALLLPGYAMLFENLMFLKGLLGFMIWSEQKIYVHYE
jgi:hypothetical protein